MCGICGTAGFKDERLLKEMTDALRHRGPDAEGFYTDTNLGLGVRRLRIIDLATGDQPIHNEDGSVWIIHNGEIFNFAELRRQLEQAGHRFYTHSDTEVIVHLYEQYGKDSVTKLEGQFCFAIWNRNTQELFIARDRLGIKPLYYHCRDGRLYFASELKAIVKDKSLPRRINPAALSLFFSFAYIPAPVSIFEGIQKLPAGHYLVFRAGELSIRRYWDLQFPDRNTPELKTEQDYLYQTCQLLSQSVKKRLISDVPLGVFLSGGIDSSAVVAMMRKVHTGTIKTFSIGYGQPDKSFNELDYAQIVADQFSTEHHKFIVQPQIIKILPKVVWHLDEPFGDSSAILNFLISAETRRQITVALSGTGGDEFFGGYPRYIGARFSLGYQKVPYFMRKIIAQAAPVIGESEASRNVAGWIKRFLTAGTLSDQDRYIRWMQFSTKEEQVNLFSTELNSSLLNFDPTGVHRSYFNSSQNIEYLDRVFYLDWKTYLADDLLHLGDRMSMANSLELRVPFCDYKLAEFSASICPSMKLSNFQLKGLLRKALRGILPDAILDRKKQGFMVPVARWIKQDLRRYIQDVLSEQEIRKMPFFNYQYIQTILERHFSGKNNFAHNIWNLLVFKLWYDLYAKD